MPELWEETAAWGYTVGQELREKIPDPELLISLHPEELASVLLPIIQQRTSGGQTLNVYNYLNELHQFREVYPRPYVDTITRAFSEALNWMLKAGILATDLSQSHGTNVFVTRRGSELRTDSQFRTFQQALLFSPSILVSHLMRIADEREKARSQPSVG